MIGFGSERGSRARIAIDPVNRLPSNIIEKAIRSFHVHVRMMRQTKHIIGLGVLLAGLAGEWPAFSQMADSNKVESPERSGTNASGILDGMTFSGKLGPVGKAPDVKDTLVFANGTFASTECDRRCGYPAGPYFVRRVGDRIEFVSESHCRHKDATLVWRGTVDNGTVKGRLSWTSDRWYWTIEKEFWFEGTLINTASPVAVAQ